MAVMITAELPGMTQELYERLAPYILDQVRDNAGFIAHAAGPIEGGLAGHRDLDLAGPARRVVLGQHRTEHPGRRSAGHPHGPGD